MKSELKIPGLSQDNNLNPGTEAGLQLPNWSIPGLSIYLNQKSKDSAGIPSILPNQILMRQMTTSWKRNSFHIISMEGAAC